MSEKSQNPTKPVRRKKSQSKEVPSYQLWIVRVAAFMMSLWTRTLRYKLHRSVVDFMESGNDTSCVVVFWHNRLFVAPEFYRRFFPERKVAVVVSASRDGGLPQEFIKSIGILPIRGSRNRRGAQALRESIEASKAGRDIALTPDGSRGPVYEMKPGAIAVAMKSGAPIMLLSFNFEKVWRLRTWDRHFIPLPFQKVSVVFDYVGFEYNDLPDAKDAVPELKKRLDAITHDPEQGLHF